MHISYSKPGLGRVRQQLPVDRHGRIEPFKQQRKKLVTVVDRIPDRTQLGSHPDTLLAGMQLRPGHPERTTQ